MVPKDSHERKIISSITKMNSKNFPNLGQNQSFDYIRLYLRIKVYVSKKPEDKSLD